MAISARVAQNMRSQSWIRQMFELYLQLREKYGPEKIYDLSLGNPILEPPEAFNRELLRLAENPPRGAHRYMPNGGYPETRAALAAHLAQHTGLPFTGSDVIMTCGAAGGLNILFKSLLDPGDEVIIFAPYFPEYCFYIDNHGGSIVVAATDGSFQPDLADLERKLTARTKVVLLNSPNNPTGAVYSRDLLKSIGELLGRAEARFGTRICLVSDEAYAKLTFDGIPQTYIYDLHPSSIVATSFSKDLSLPGERIGYVALSPTMPGRAELMDALTFSNRVLGFVNASALMQRVVQELLEETVDISFYQQRRDRIQQALIDLGYDTVKPQGAFYFFPRSPIPDDVAFIHPMQRYNVLIVPGSGFGAPGYFRISYSVEDWVLDGALAGFAAAAGELGLRRA